MLNEERIQKKNSEGGEIKEEDEPLSANSSDVSSFEEENEEQTETETFELDKD